MLVLLACAPEPTPEPPPYVPPDAAGPYAVGTAESTYAGPAGDTRAQVWFPASDAGDDAYVYDDVLAGAARVDAVPDCSAARPVVVFSHGNGGMRYQSIFLTEHLASQGFVVVAPDHVGNTFDDDSASLTELLLRRPAEAVSSFDWLVDTDADGRLAGCLDAADGYAMMGHSFGGYTTLAVAGAPLDAAASAAWCERAVGTWLCDEVADALATAGLSTAELGDPRVWAAIPMAPAGYEALVGGLDDVSAPTLVLGASRDDLTPMATQVRPIYDDLVVTPRALGTLEDASHYSFSDACTLAPVYDACAPPYLPDADAHPVIAGVATAWVRWVRGDTRAAEWLPDPDVGFLEWEGVE